MLVVNRDPPCDPPVQSTVPSEPGELIQSETLPTYYLHYWDGYLCGYCVDVYDSYREFVLRVFHLLTWERIV